ncbi:MAG: hypothetical protein OWS74_01645, partial [Firmicutes bacterium]|nr:hypothetical protein [Bacillota bacterium]
MARGRKAGRRNWWILLPALGMSITGCFPFSSSQRLAEVDGIPITQTMWKTAYLSTQIIHHDPVTSVPSPTHQDVQHLVEQTAVRHWATRHLPLSSASLKRRAQQLMTHQIRPK